MECFERQRGRALWQMTIFLCSKKVGAVLVQVVESHRRETWKWLFVALLQVQLCLRYFTMFKQNLHVRTNTRIKVRIVALISLSDRPVSHQRTWGKTDSVGRLRTWGWYSTAAALTRLRLLSLLKIQGFRTQLWLLPGSNRGIWTLKWSHMDEREEGFCLLEGMRISRRHQLSPLVSDHFHLAAIQSRYSRFLCMCLCMCVFVSVCLRARVCVIGNSDGFAGSFTSKTTATDGWTNPLLWLSGSDAHIHACAHIHTLTHTHSLQNTTWPATV